MAVWQVEFHVVPRRALPGSRNALARAVADDTNWWADALFPKDYIRRLAAVAPPAPSWSADLETWGSVDGNRVEVWTEERRVCRVMARVDVRRLDSKFGAALIQFVRSAGAVLVRGDGLLVEPVISEYVAALRSSDAWRFASDPMTFLRSQASADDQE
jgi:hypothetical protein